MVLPILGLQAIYGSGRGRSPPGPRRTKRLAAPARATPVPGRSEPRCTQDDTRRPGQAGTEVAQARRRPRPEPAAAGQASPAGRPTARRDLAPSAATWGQGWPQTAETAMPGGTRAAPSATTAP